MSDLHSETDRKGGPRWWRHASGCLAVLLALAVLVAGGFFAYSQGKDALEGWLAPPADYPGPGTGRVLVEVNEGESASEIAQALVAADVVKSTEAFTDAAKDNPQSRSIQAGTYRMQRKMSAAGALELLLDTDNLVSTKVTIPEGFTVDQVVERLAARSSLTTKKLKQALDHPGRLGLPPYAHGHVEGYLFPATYKVSPGDDAHDVLAKMVDRFKRAAGQVHLVRRAEKLGRSPHDVVIIASLIQSEGRYEQDLPKISRVIYNRLAKDMKLQLDSTVHYVVGSQDSVSTTEEERAVDSPYNTYQNKGLPPTPISSAGKKALHAALHPAKGPWLYFVTTNPATGETKFAKTYKEHLKHKKEFEQWCRHSDVC